MFLRHIFMEPKLASKTLCSEGHFGLFSLLPLTPECWNYRCELLFVAVFLNQDC